MNNQDGELDSKTPAEIITITFDFSAIVKTLSLPVIAIEVISGTDINVMSMLLGTPQISGKRVLQRIQAGIRGTVYKVSCLITSDGIEKFELSGELTVT